MGKNEVTSYYKHNGIEKTELKDSLIGSKCDQYTQVTRVVPNTDLDMLKFGPAFACHKANSINQFEGQISLVTSKTEPLSKAAANLMFQDINQHLFASFGETKSESELVR